MRLHVRYDLCTSHTPELRSSSYVFKPLLEAFLPIWLGSRVPGTLNACTEFSLILILIISFMQNP